MDDVAWAALTLALTALGGIWTWFAFRRRGLAPGLRAAGFTLLPAAAYLTRTLQMFTRIAEAVADWATSLVFSPFVWLGVALAGAGAALIAASGLLRRRALPSGRTRAPRGPRGELPEGRTAPDDGTDDIEALLRKHGIT